MDQPRRTSPTRWLELATLHIAFGPDRKAVRRELEEHMEDKALDFQRLYPELTQKEALEQAAADMGDPVEIGMELARIHRPWLGYLWRASQAVLAGAALLVLATLGRQAFDGTLENWLSHWERNVEWAEIPAVLYEDAESDWEGERLAVYTWEPALAARQSHGTLTVSRAALWREDGVYVLYLDARLECDFPNRPPEYLWNVLTARDDQGGEYLDGWLSRGGQTGLGWSQTNLMLYDFDPAAEQVYLEYLPGTELSLTIDLKEGKLT